MTTHPTTPPSTDLPSDNPRLALLRALNTPPYDLAAGKTGSSLCEAAQLIDAHEAAVLRGAADHLARQADELWAPGKAAHTVMHADAVELRRMAAGAEGPQACGARESEPRTGTSPCVLPAGHGGDKHQDKWTNQWPVAKGMDTELFTGPQWETRDPEAEERWREIQRDAVAGAEETAAERYQDMLHWKERAEVAEAALAQMTFVPPVHYRRDDDVDCCVHAVPVGPGSCRHCWELADG